ncbi:Aste57867_5964 [Aphanomyces stellatus]|uniref:Palmitoyltransferase n=1 Tax=Aphanomyces stellatus TaxID=120398 RepID=A0A485KHD2_9STRA|nr:hypothetical protein As57867_005950 [Aphanomyces stellatus]VFT82981.1 Aste57867_5964 [Aphanomyces stellatus]
MEYSVTYIVLNYTDHTSQAHHTPRAAFIPFSDGTDDDEMKNPPEVMRDCEAATFLNKNNTQERMCWVERAFHRGKSLVIRTNRPICGMGPRWCSVGPHWPLMLITFTIFTAFALFTIFVVATSPEASWTDALGGLFICSSSLVAYALVACTDPGVVPYTPVQATPFDTYCDYCASYRPTGTTHCSECQVCILEYDHHCPWTGKCIGKHNLRYFYLWLFTLVLSFVYEMIQLTTYLLPPPLSSAGP